MVAKDVVLGMSLSAADADRALFDAWKAGDASARDRLICRLGGIARKVADGFRGLGEQEDLISEAMIGVCVAVDEWRAGELSIGSFCYQVAWRRVRGYIRASAPTRRMVVSIHAYSATEQVEEWRSHGGQEEATLVGEIRTIAESSLPPRELDVILLRMQDMSGTAIAKKLGTDRFRVSERETAAKSKLAAAVNDD